MMKDKYHQTRCAVVLEHLVEFGTLMVDALLPRHPKARLARMLLGLDAPHRSTFSEKEKHRFSSMLYYLRRQGFIKRSGPRHASSWNITKRGKNYLIKSRVRFFPVLPEKDGIWRIVTFDIPEPERKKRNWLRVQLIGCGFEQLQKSVWIGERPLPEEFMEQMRVMHMMRYVHIVGIAKGGTLTEVIS